MSDFLWKIPETYECTHQEYIEDIKSQAGIFKHKKTGARIAILSNTDTNKVFNIAFRTPPKDKTGVAHILEHSVLCGSKAFPAKDPFIELVKGSLNTFLNAMTYSDKTMYPVASYNNKDFQNLIHVYLDAVFYPNIYTRPEIFKQEGWHYELEQADGPLIYNGVVFNEMKGAFSSPEEVLSRKISDSLFPDTVYGLESGGDPACIPDLTYEAFLDFHRSYYHPSNSYIYLYGDMDVFEKLEFIDKMYLSHFDALEIDSAIGIQKPFEAMKVMEATYAIGSGDSEKDAAYLSYNAVIEDSQNRELYMAFQILDFALMSAPGAPLKKALIDKGIGKDIYGMYDNGIRQPYLSVVAKFANEDQKEDFISVIRETLKGLVTNGVNKKTLEGAINYFEFKEKEGDFGRYPKGLMYGLKMFDSWLYEDSAPFIHLKTEDTFKFLRAMLSTGYYEELIQKYLLDNPHSSLLILKPEKGRTKSMEEAEAKRLADYKATLSQEALEALIEDTKALKLYQDTPSTPAENETIPMLSIEDIVKTAAPLCNELSQLESLPLLKHPMETNGIAYLKFLFDIRDIPENQLPYVAILAEVLGGIDTNTHTYQELVDETTMYTGGITTNVNVFPTWEIQEYKSVFTVSAKALYSNVTKTLALINEMLFTSKLEDEKRLLEILDQIKSRLQMSLPAAGHGTAANRATAYFSKGAAFKDITAGISYLWSIETLIEDFDSKKTELISQLKTLCKKVFTKERLFMDFIGTSEDYEKIKADLMDFVDKIPEAALEPGAAADIQCHPDNEAFITSGMVQHDACAGNFAAKGYAYTGSLNVLKVILSYDYLWNNIRVKGGAYGCMCGFNFNGDGYFVSYRDPKLKETYEVFAGIPDYIRNFTVNQRDLTKYIIGAIGEKDTPLTPAGQGSRSLSAYLCGTTFEAIQKGRDELLSTTQEKIRALADIAASIVDANHICVIGSESQIDANKALFKTVKPLFKQVQ